MAAQNTLTAGPAWATPVKPDELAQRLEHYAEVLPTLKALRLCHRFGQGQDAHVTKLPVELELAIEAIIIQDKQCPSQHGWEKWADKFRHYERRCAPMDHVEDMPSPPADQLSEMYTPCTKCEEIIDVKLCDARCQPGDPRDLCWPCSQKLDPDNCTESCREQKSAAMNDLMPEWAWGWDLNPVCQPGMEWEQAIDQTGAFAPYDTILEEQFGLKAFFAPSRITSEVDDIWPRHPNHRFCDGELLRTTICYLTVSQTLAPKKTGITSVIEHAAGDRCDLSSIQVTKLGQPSFALTNTVKKRFQRALDILNLKAYEHPSQGTSLVRPRNMPTLSGPNQGGSPTVPPDETWPALVKIATYCEHCDRDDTTTRYPLALGCCSRMVSRIDGADVP